MESSRCLWPYVCCACWSRGLCWLCTTSSALQVAWLMQIDWKAPFVRGNSDPNRRARVATFFRSNKQSPNFMGENCPARCLFGQ